MKLPFYGAGDSAAKPFYGEHFEPALAFYGESAVEPPLEFYGGSADAEYVLCVNCALLWHSSEYLMCAKCWRQ